MVPVAECTRINHHGADEAEGIPYAGILDFTNSIVIVNTVLVEDSFIGFVASGRNPAEQRFSVEL